MWLFYRKDIALERLTDLKGKRIAIGTDGSGTQALARQLLELNTLNSESGNLLQQGGENASAMLLKGDLDAAFFVIAASSSLVDKLLRSEAVTLFRIMPPLYRWRVRSRIYRWYSELATVDPESHNHLSRDQLRQHLTELNRIEDEVIKVTIPLSYSVELYELRIHLEYLRYKLGQIQARIEAGGKA